jgi:hypothetical protein
MAGWLLACWIMMAGWLIAYWIMMARWLLACWITMADGFLRAESLVAIMIQVSGARSRPGARQLSEASCCTPADIRPVRVGSLTRSR